MFEQRDRRAWYYAAGGIVGAAAIMSVPILVLGRPDLHLPVVINPVRVILTTLTVALAVIWGRWFTRLSFIHFDEFLREGSKFAWYWGGLLGIAVSAPIYAFIGTGGLHWLDPTRPVGHDLFDAFVLGYSVSLFPQALSFLAVYLWWKRAKR